ncbi:MAG: response regulator, partial [Pseudomonadota bacterium]
MVVEDDAETRARFVEKIDGSEDFSVIATAGSRSEALAALEDCSPDVLLVDLGLPDGDGTDVIEHAA